ncbi:MAG: metallophosphatase family protein [Lachnospiraceae bacterium]|nr:metallophosphatase family protein [Lachnospiraceae bacterium]
MKIAVLSDTHNLLRTEVLEIIRDCDAVIHGGDITSQKVLDTINANKKENAPFFVVRGNNDKEWAKHIPDHLEFKLAGIHFYLCHIKKEIPDELPNTQIVIYGHSHKYAAEEIGERLWLNPGSCGRRRFHQAITMAVLEIHDGKWNVTRIDIPHVQTGQNRMEIPADNLLAVISEIMKRMDKGQTVQEMSQKMNIDASFTEEICRIRVTHPGVTAQGIVDKVEVNRTIPKG